MDDHLSGSNASWRSVPLCCRYSLVRFGHLPVQSEDVDDASFNSVTTVEYCGLIAVLPVECGPPSEVNASAGIKAIADIAIASNLLIMTSHSPNHTRSAAKSQPVNSLPLIA